MFSATSSPIGWERVPDRAGEGAASHMHIGLITSSFLPQIGGLEWKVHFLATEYRKRGHRVTVFHRQPANRHLAPLALAPTYETRPVGPRPFPGYIRTGIEALFFARQLRRSHQRAPLDILHCHSLELPTKYGIQLKKATGLPVVATTCGHDVMTAPEIGFGARLRPWYDRIVRDNVRRADAIGSISSAMTAELRSLGTTAAILEIPNGVDWPAFQTGATGWLKARLGLGPSDLVVASVGRNHRVKDYSTAIRAFAKAAGHDPRIHYAVVGKDASSLAGLANELGLQNRVHLLDGVPMAGVPKVLWGADIFMNTSIMEGFPQVVVQAMSCARPCVLSDCPGNADLNSSGCAVFGKAGDSDSLAEALKAVLASPGKRQQMGERAHAASRRYCWSQIAAEYLAVFDKLAPGLTADTGSGRPDRGIGQGSSGTRNALLAESLRG